MNTNTPAQTWTVKVRSSRPQIHRLDCPGIDPIHSRILDWQWVNMMDLFKHLCGIVIRRDGKTPTLMPSISAPRDLYDRYAILGDPKSKSPTLMMHCPDDPRDAQVTWIGRDGYAFYKPEWPKDDHRHFTYVPLGFSNAILDLAENGIIKVRTKKLASTAKFLIGIDREEREKVLWFNSGNGSYS